MSSFRVGIDTGGTFTDLIALDESTGEIHLGKVFSTPGQPAEALLNALAQAQIPLPTVKQLIHGTTVATNALLEHKGAKVAYVTTATVTDTAEWVTGSTDIATAAAEAQNQLVGLIGLLALAAVTATEAGLAVKRVRLQLG